VRVRLTHVTVKASGTRALRQSVLDVDAVRIGRGTDNHISIRGLSVPLHHSVLVRRGEQITIDRVDAGTIEVDGREGSGRALRPGNVVRIGDLEIRVVEPGDGEDLAIEVEQVERSVTELDASRSGRTWAWSVDSSRVAGCQSRVGWRPLEFSSDFHSSPG